MRIKVLHSYPVWLPQTQTWMYNQVKYLPADAVECHAVCERTENLDQFGMANIHNLDRAPRWQYYWDKGLRKLRLRRYLGFTIGVAKRAGAQVLHSHFGNVGWADLGAARRAGLKHVVTFYGLDVNMLPTQDRRWLLRYGDLFMQGDLFLCEGPHMRQCLIDLGCPEDKVKVQHLGVEVNRITFEPRQWALGEPLRVLIAATFREKKGIPYALEALARIKNDVPLEITLIGDASPEKASQQEKQRIMETLNRYQLQSLTRLMGFQTQKMLWQEAYKHHIFLSPSVTAEDGDTEGGAPVALIEMAASGMPIISAIHCDIPNVIKNAETGWLAPERNVDALVTHLRWWVKQSGHWQRMLEAARNHIEKEFNAREQGQRLMKRYQELVDG